MSPMKPVKVKTRDGLVIHGYLTVPAGSDGKNLPLIVHPHGGPHGPRDEWGFNPEVQLLANRGYAVLQMNYRGSGGYGSRFEFAGYRKWGTTMQDDLTDSVRWAVAQGIADPARTCIYGASYGGYAALMGGRSEGHRSEPLSPPARSSHPPTARATSGASTPKSSFGPIAATPCCR